MNIINSLQTIFTIAVGISLVLIRSDQTRDTAKLQQIDAYVTETRARTEILERQRTTDTETLDALRDDLAMLRRYYDAKTALDIARRCEDGDAEHRARLERRVQDEAAAWAEVSHHHATPLPLADPSTTTSLLDS